jgi:hypothetical protein
MKRMFGRDSAVCVHKAEIKKAAARSHMAGS